MFLLCSSSGSPHAFTLLNSLVSSVEMKVVVPVWEGIWSSVITRRTTKQYKKPESIGAELAIRAQPGISEFNRKPSAENAWPQAGPFQPNRGFLFFSDPQEIFTKCVFMHYHYLASCTSLSSSLVLYALKQGHHMLHKEAPLNDF